MDMALNDIHVSGLGKLATTTGKRLVLLATALAISIRRPSLPILACRSMIVISK